MTDRKYKLHSSKNCFGKRSNKEAVKKVLVGSLGKISTAVNHYHKSEKKYKRVLKSTTKQNKMLFSMAKYLGLHRDLNNIRKICARISKKHDYSMKDLSISDSDSSLSSDIK